MAFSTELVARADEYQTVNLTTTSSSGSFTLPEGVWMCSLTGNVDIVEGDYITSYIELDGVRGEVDGVVDDGTGARGADVGVCLPSVTGGRNVPFTSSCKTGSLTFNAARIG